MVDHNSIIELKDFAQGLKNCLAAKRKSLPETTEPTEAHYLLNYFEALVNIHLQLKELEFDEYAAEMEKAYEKAI